MNLFKTIKNKGLISTLYKAKRMLFVKEKDVLGLMHRLGSADYLERYSYVLQEPNECDTPIITNKYPNKIWTCWLQGIENAPILVKKCIETQQHYYGNDVIIITSNNVSTYVNLPDYILQKWKIGIISNTHFSDIVRICLLAEYGGIWIDATVLLTSKIPLYLTKLDFFVFKYTFPYAKGYASNFFIIAKPNNYFVIQIKNFLFEYWKKENKLVDYFIFHIFLSKIIDFSTNKKTWDSIPHIDSSTTFSFHLSLFEEYNSEHFKHVNKSSFLHKLSYKFDEAKTKISNTYYQKIING